MKKGPDCNQSGPFHVKLFCFQALRIQIRMYFTINYLTIFSKYAP